MGSTWAIARCSDVEEIRDDWEVRASLPVAVLTCDVCEGNLVQFIDRTYYVHEDDYIRLRGLGVPSAMNHAPVIRCLEATSDYAGQPPPAKEDPPTVTKKIIDWM